MVMYLFFLFITCLILGVLGVVSCPSPSYATGALMFSAIFGCGVLISLGASFVGLVLLLIYLGGMLVVFAYSVALAAESYHEGWIDYTVFMSGLWYAGLALFAGLWGMELRVDSGMEVCGVFNNHGDIGGMMLLFSSGGWLLFLVGCGLLLALFVVLEMVRVMNQACLQVP